MGTDIQQDVILGRDRLFVAITRPQMFAGVTYNFFVLNFVLTTEFFLFLRSIWVIPAALVIHGAGVLVCLQDPRAFDILLLRMILCPRVRNYRFWRCNSYQA